MTTSFHCCIEEVKGENSCCQITIRVNLYVGRDHVQQKWDWYGYHNYLGCISLKESVLYLEHTYYNLQYCTLQLTTTKPSTSPTICIGVHFLSTWTPGKPYSLTLNPSPATTSLSTMKTFLSIIKRAHLIFFWSRGWRSIYCSDPFFFAIQQKTFQILKVFVFSIRQLSQKKMINDGEETVNCSK